MIRIKLKLLEYVMKYLYGASVQGIQGFIFETNKLQEIVGASEIVKGIEKEFTDNYSSSEIILNAAGNIKAIFDNEEALKKVVLEFPKHIMKQAYGISISQAVVALKGDEQSQDELNLLEQRLKVQRNRVSNVLDLSLNIMELNPSTSKPIVSYEKRQKKSVPVDRATKQKLVAYKRFLEKNPHLKEFGDISSLSNGKNKIAIVHADGNGLGALLPTLSKKGIKLSNFSKALDKATKTAFSRAKDDSMSIRDVILGGDDMVVVCNANDALTFTKNFLKYFEEETKSSSDIGSKLTACAGIAYTNEKYPFHYAVSLAEELCSQTKKHANKLVKSEYLEFVPSSLMFHNIQSSNFQSWDIFVDDELSIVNNYRYIEKDKEKLKKQPLDTRPIRCDFGPYYLDHRGQPLISNFLNTIGAYRCNGSPSARLRVWLSELYNSETYASALLNRINDMAQQNKEWNSCIMEKNLKQFNQELSNEQLIIEKDNYLKTPIYDILQILSVTEAK